MYIYYIMDYVELQFVKMSSRAVVPTKTTKYSIGLGLHSPDNYLIHPKNKFLFQLKSSLEYPQDTMEELLPNLV